MNDRTVAVLVTANGGIWKLTIGNGNSATGMPV